MTVPVELDRFSLVGAGVRVRGAAAVARPRLHPRVAGHLRRFAARIPKGDVSKTKKKNDSLLATVVARWRQRRGPLFRFAVMLIDDEGIRAQIYERQEIYEGLMERGESFYQERMEETVRVLQAAGRLQDDEGRKVMFSDEHSVPLTVVKSDGGFTYDTSDLATIRHRIDEERGQWLIYVTDAGQVRLR